MAKGDNFGHDAYGDFLRGAAPKIKADGRMNLLEAFWADAALQESFVDHDGLALTAEKADISGRRSNSGLGGEVVVVMSPRANDDRGVFGDVEAIAGRKTEVNEGEDSNTPRNY